MTSPPVVSPLDLAKALTLVDGDKALLRELVEVFLEELPGWGEELRAGVQAGDAQRIERAAHGLKGALASLGATVARDLAAELERLGGSACLETVPPVLQTLEHELARLTEFLVLPGWSDGV